MRRREFITLLGGTAAAWPLAARAQPDGRSRRVGVLLAGAESDPLIQAYVAALRLRLQQLGWIEGRNLRIDARFNAGELARMRANAQELVGLAPDVIVGGGVAGARALQERTQTIPIVFVQVGDPVASGVVGSIARPEGNTTGITNLFPSIAGKWLELLKEAAPHVTRVALIFNPDFSVTENYLAAIEAAAAALTVKAIRTPVRSATDIERAIDAFAAEANGGLIQVPPQAVHANRELIVRLARRHRLPAMYNDRLHVADGGLVSYGPDSLDLYRLAASYVDRILRGAKPGDLPVQFPTKFDLVINLKTAKAIGLAIPATLTARADELIE
jgi:putative tryptophan/tyrosine transport system substrate-binding protein